MNPSTEDIMKAIKEVNAKNILFSLILNIQLAARQTLIVRKCFVVEVKQHLKDYYSVVYKSTSSC